MNAKPVNNIFFMVSALLCCSCNENSKMKVLFPELVRGEMSMITKGENNEMYAYIIIRDKPISHVLKWYEGKGFRMSEDNELVPFSEPLIT